MGSFDIVLSFPEDAATRSCSGASVTGLQLELGNRKRVAVHLWQESL